MDVFLKFIAIKTFLVYFYFQCHRKAWIISQNISARYFLSSFTVVSLFGFGLKKEEKTSENKNGIFNFKFV